MNLKFIKNSAQMASQNFTLELKFIRLNDLPLPDYDVAPSVYLRKTDINEVNAFYESIKFIKQFLKLNYIGKISGEVWQTQEVFLSVLDEFIYEYQNILSKRGWKFDYNISFR